ncbi:CPXCG motif-containing cysteine-rich protein [Algoriphagus sp. 4150]|nr:CPXCG motif-containing cysteine-rich protein [Algoriphagus sp. 4150]
MYADCPSVSSQEYIEDCEIYCNPVAVQLEIKEGGIISFEAK